jgi:hypothetical protein
LVSDQTTDPRWPDAGPASRDDDVVKEAIVNNPEPLLALLVSLASRVSTHALDELWIFPPKQSARQESALVVGSAFHDDADRRRVMTAHYRSTRQPNGQFVVEESLVEHAVAPVDRLERIIEGVIRRLDDDLAQLHPVPSRIRGETEAWTALLDSISATKPAAAA